jgi:hypothetical protein
MKGQVVSNYMQRDLGLRLFALRLGEQGKNTAH